MNYDFPESVEVPFTKGNEAFKFSLIGLPLAFIIAVFIHGLKQLLNDATSGIKDVAEARKAFLEKLEKLSKGEFRVGHGGGRRLSAGDRAWKEAWGLRLKEIAQALGEPLTAVNTAVSKRDEEKVTELLASFVKKATVAKGCPERFQEVLEKNIEAIDALCDELQERYVEEEAKKAERIKDVASVLEI